RRQPRPRPGISRRPLAALCRPSTPIAISRTRNFCTLPVTVIGKTSVKRQWCGTLSAASRARFGTWTRGRSRAAVVTTEHGIVGRWAELLESADLRPADSLAEVDGAFAAEIDGNMRAEGIRLVVEEQEIERLQVADNRGAGSVGPELARPEIRNCVPEMPQQLISELLAVGAAFQPAGPRRSREMGAVIDGDPEALGNLDRRYLPMPLILRFPISSVTAPASPGPRLHFFIAAPAGAPWLTPGFSYPRSAGGGQQKVKLDAVLTIIFGFSASTLSSHRISSREMA